MFRPHTLCIAVALAASVLATAACSSSEKPVDIAANTKQVCAGTNKVMEDGIQKFTTAMSKSTAAKDDASKAASKSELGSIFNSMASGLRGQAAKAADDKLKKQLELVATDLEKASKNPESVGQSDSDMSKNGSALQSMCKAKP